MSSSGDSLTDSGPVIPYFFECGRCISSVVVVRGTGVFCLFYWFETERVAKCELTRKKKRADDQNKENTSIHLLLMSHV